MREDSGVGATGFPAGAGVLLGVGLGGLFDGVAFHQMLQWHHMLSNWRPGDFTLNTLGDGLFHAATYIAIVIALLLLWRAARRTHAPWPGAGMAGAILLGWGLFNLIEGLVDHILLGVHHVNERVDPSRWIYWDVGFLLWGAAFVALGWGLLAKSRRNLARSAAQMAAQRRLSR